MAEGARPVLEPGPYTSWDERGVADPYVIRAGSYFYLYYLGQDRARRQRLGVARSTDGVRWEKLRVQSDPRTGRPRRLRRKRARRARRLEFARLLLDALHRPRPPARHRRLGLARSTDGVHWQKRPAVFSGAASWDSKVICDPTVQVDGDDGPRLVRRRRHRLARTTI